VRTAQGLAHMGKGLISPYHITDRQLLSGGLRKGFVVGLVEVDFPAQGHHYSIGDGSNTYPNLHSSARLRRLFRYTVSAIGSCWLVRSSCCA
jgi:hypothetical protein